MAQILIVDDDPNLRRVLRGVLETAGHEVTEESDGSRALGRFAGHPSDLVITDIYMPERDHRHLYAGDGWHRVFHSGTAGFS